MVAIDADGGEVADPRQLPRRHDVVAMEGEHRVAAFALRDGDEDVRRPGEGGGHAVAGPLAIEDERVDPLGPEFAALSGLRTVPPTEAASPRIARAKASPV